MEYRQQEESGEFGGTTTLRADHHASWFVLEAQNLLLRNAMTDMSVCVIKGRTMYTIR